MGVVEVLAVDGPPHLVCVCVCVSVWRSLQREKGAAEGRATSVYVCMCVCTCACTCVAVVAFFIAPSATGSKILAPRNLMTHPSFWSSQT
jgi:uncharacterized membrane protein YwzB